MALLLTWLIHDDVDLPFFKLQSVGEFKMKIRKKGAYLVTLAACSLFLIHWLQLGDGNIQGVNYFVWGVIFLLYALHLFNEQDIIDLEEKYAKKQKRRV